MVLHFLIPTKFQWKMIKTEHIKKITLCDYDKVVCVYTARSGNKIYRNSLESVQQNCTIYITLLSTQSIGRSKVCALPCDYWSASSACAALVVAGRM